MYWPNGVPRVYAVNGPNIVVSEDRGPSDPPSTDQLNSVGENNDTEEVAAPTNQSKDHNDRPTPHTETPKWEDEAINGLCVSRSGHMFATITESSISLWQTRVRLEKPRVVFQQHWDLN